ncbi:Uncharacterised protein [Salmonella enterica subsp. enterica]|uniref:Uncharacterized protein n=1 Tax=Salmonella enterica I TaxID=59201 RepID=A0A3S4IR58_SALET|nr:Uncharacterised protein [Salmonella enterica subsp. enterica]
MLIGTTTQRGRCTVGQNVYWRVSIEVASTRTRSGGRATFKITGCQASRSASFSGIAAGNQKTAHAAQHGPA